MSPPSPDFHFLEGQPDFRPLERSFALSDGRGGTGQLCLAGFPAHAWHSLYAPFGTQGPRIELLSLGLGLEIAGRECWLPETPSGLREAGPFIVLAEFHEDPLPRWAYRVGEARLEVLLAPERGASAMVARVRVHGARAGSRLLLRPAFTDGFSRGELPGLYASESPQSRGVHLRGREECVELLHPEAQVVAGPSWLPERRTERFWFRPATLALALPAGESVRDFRVAARGVPFQESGAVLEQETRRLRQLPVPGDPRFPFLECMARALDRHRLHVRTADDFLVAAHHLGSDPRQALVALHRLHAAFGRGDEAREALAAAGEFLLGNLGADYPDDFYGPFCLAALEWIHVAFVHCEAHGDARFLDSEILPRGLQIVAAIREGGPHHPTMEPDGRITFENTSIYSDTEGNLLWMRALRALADAADRVERSAATRDMREIAASVEAGLEAWLSAAARGADDWTASEVLLALNLPGTSWPAEPAAALLERITDRLYSPRGLRPAPRSGGNSHAADPRLPSLLGPYHRARIRAGQLAEAGREHEDLARVLPGLRQDLVLGHVPIVLPANLPVAELEAAHLDRYVWSVAQPGLETDVEIALLQSEPAPMGAEPRGGRSS